MSNWWDKPLDDLNEKEWEALCDGCGLCCLNKIEDIDTGEIFFSRVACKLLDIESARCSDYACRQQRVPDCLSLRAMERKDYRFLPPSCSYRLRHEDKSLPKWHPLLTQTQESVKICGRSVSHFALSERDGHAIEDYLIYPLENVLGNSDE